MIDVLRDRVCAHFGFSHEQWEALLNNAYEDLETDPPVPEGECFFCHTPTTSWDFCHGCEQYVCQAHIGGELVPLGAHVVHEHMAMTN